MDDTNPLPLRAILPAQFERLEDAVEGDLRGSGDASFSTMVWKFVRSSAAQEVTKTLDFDLWEVLAMAWAKATELHSQKNNPSDQTTIVSLGKHDFKTAVYPELTIDFGLPKNPTLRFTVEVAAHFEAAALNIRNGHILAVEAGDASVSAEFRYGKTRLHKEESPKVKFAGRREFRQPGIPIA
jgi:hypothetical protein